MAEVSSINANDLFTINRYNKDLIFTNVRETLIIVNTYQILPIFIHKKKEWNFIVMKIHDKCIEDVLIVLI